MPISHLVSDLHIGSLGLVDLLIVLVVAGSLIGALRRRAGILGAIGSAASSALFCWLVVAGLIVWAPDSVAHTVAASAFAQNVPLPTRAFAEAGQWIGAALTSVR